MSKKQANTGKTIIAQNKKARHDFFIEESVEAGIMLLGSEVKALRAGKGNITESYAEEDNGEIFLVNSYIGEYKGANRFNHHPHRPRKLLLKQKEISKFFGKLKVKGYTLVPLILYFNTKNMVKIELGLAKGKKQHDKRATEKDRDWQRDKERLVKGNT